MYKRNNAPFVTNGCSNHCDYDRASLDFYATDPRSAKWLLKLEPNLSNNIWECACGDLALSNILPPQERM